MIPLPTQSDVGAKPPQSTIIIANGIPWTNDYNHVRLFGNKSELLSFVQSKQVAAFTLSTPVRWSDLTYRANGNENSFIECNYIAFQNAPFTSSWYFGFITSVEWLSNGSCKIAFEPDYFQNNIYDVSINPCFVEREHCTTAEDSYYSNLVPEGLETGEYRAQEHFFPTSGGYHYSLVSSATSEGNQPIPVNDNNLYTGLSRYTATSYQDMTTILNNFQSSGNADSIVQLIQYPAMCDTADLQNQTINIPALTEERRRELVKQSKGETEVAKVSIRNARRDLIEQVKKMVKDGLSEDVAKDIEATAQRMTDEYGKKVDDFFAKKEKDIMTI